MKKYIFLAVGIFLLSGCVEKKLDLCKVKKIKCLAECKVEYKEGVKYKLCEAKCYTAYSACKTKEKIEEGIEKIKGD